MAVDCFLKIDGIEGESADAKHGKEISIESFSFGATQTGTMAFGGGGGAGKANFQDFHFTMKVNKASPKLFLACATGQHIKEATLTCRKAGGGQQEFITWKFSDLLVSSYTDSGHGSGDELPMDSISLNYSKLEVDYKPQKADGSME